MKTKSVLFVGIALAGMGIGVLVAPSQPTYVDEYNQAKIEIDALNEELSTLTKQLDAQRIKTQAAKEEVSRLREEISRLQRLYKEYESIKRDIDLPFEYQLHTYNICKKYDVDYELALAVLLHESGGVVDTVNTNANGTVDKGLMQINSVNYKWLEEELGITNIEDPYQNIEAGVFMLGEFSAKYDDVHQILMSYNMGSDTMRKLNRKGIYSSEYSRQVVSLMEEIK